MCAPVIAGVDAAPVFEFCKHVLDLVALFVERFVVVDLDFPVLPWRNAGRNTLFDQGFSEPVSVIATVSQQVFGPGQRVKQQGRTFVVAHLAFGQKQQQRSPLSVCHSVEF